MYGSTQWLIWPTLLFDVILEDIGASQRQKMSINILRCVKQVMFLIFLVIPTFDNLLRRRFPIAMPRLLSRPALDLVSQLRYEDWYPNFPCWNRLHYQVLCPNPMHGVADQRGHLASARAMHGTCWHHRSRWADRYDGLADHLSSLQEFWDNCCLLSPMAIRTPDLGCQRAWIGRALPESQPYHGILTPGLQHRLPRHCIPWWRRTTARNHSALICHGIIQPGQSRNCQEMIWRRLKDTPNKMILIG